MKHICILSPFCPTLHHFVLFDTILSYFTPFCPILHRVFLRLSRGRLARNGRHHRQGSAKAETRHRCFCSSTTTRLVSIPNNHSRTLYYEYQLGAENEEKM
jgi:hypothetical protein